MSNKISVMGVVHARKNRVTGSRGHNQMLLRNCNSLTLADLCRAWREESGMYPDIYDNKEIDLIRSLLKRFRAIISDDEGLYGLVNSIPKCNSTRWAEVASCDSIATFRSGKNEWHTCSTIRSSPVSNDTR